MKRKINTLKTELESLLKYAEKESISLGTIIKFLAGRGHAILLILFSLPLSLPMQIPGFSTPFGLIIAFLGLRIAFGHRIWIPKTVLEKKISYSVLEKIAQFIISISEKMSFLFGARMTWLVKTPTLQICHGLVIFLLGILLALPLPIPLTNLLAAIPALAFGIAFLEDDGVMIIVAYTLSTICFIAFASLIWFGAEGINMLFHKLV